MPRSKVDPKNKYHRYSGPKSTGFWARVNALPDARRGELYSCGVLLQNMEEDVLHWLATAEKESTDNGR